MNKKNPHLLPSGLYDLLPPDARTESELTRELLGCFASFGYEQVSPPLLEFEASLLAGRGENVAAQTFRVMDPLSQAMMGFRPDITLQVARIATSRLASAPRPLRLCYGGPILRVKADPLQNERQLTQAGIELIGEDSWAADAEVMTVAAEALLMLGVEEVSIDISLPGLLADLCPEVRDDMALRAQVKDAVQRRDAAAISALLLKHRAKLADVMQAAGPASKALAALRKLGVFEAEKLEKVVAQVQKNCPQINLTLDPLEYRGFDYHLGLGFSIFARDLRHELGRGGRYAVGGGAATGFTLYATHLMRLVKPTAMRKRVLVPSDIDPQAARKLREDGWITLGGMSADAKAEAAKLGIKDIWQDGKIVSV